MPSYSTDLDKELEEMARRELNGDRHAMTAPVGIPGRLDRDDARFPQEDKNIAIGVHLGSLIGMFMSGGALAWAIPLIAYFTTGHRSELLKDHIKSQLNFQISFLLAGLAALALAFTVVGLIVAIPLMLTYILAGVWGGVKGSIAASNGEDYDYPLAYKFLK